MDWLGKNVGRDDFEADLLERFGHDQFRPAQRDIIAAGRDGRDVIAVMPTGSGKSVCFQSVALLSPEEETTVVVSPLIALIRDQVGKLQSIGIGAEGLYSTMTDSEHRKVMDCLKERRVPLLYLSPERLNTAGFLRNVPNVLFERTVVDEAHCISQWGPDFRPDYRRIPDFNKAVGVSHVMAFTATASATVRSDIRRNLGLQNPYEYVEDIHRPNLAYHVEHLSSSEKITKILELIDRFAGGENDAVIIYCSTRVWAEKLSSLLKARGVKNACYHGGLDGTLRTTLQNEFERGNPRVLVATNAFGMGMDKGNVRLIIHNDIPGSVESYLQETGRAGRDGVEAHCVLLYNKDDLKTQRYFLNVRAPNAGFIRAVFKSLWRQTIGQNKAEDGTFSFNATRLYMGYSYAERQRKGKMSVFTRDEDKRVDVNAVLGLLQQCGLLQLLPKSRMKLSTLPEDSKLLDEMATFGSVRRDAGLVQLGQMVQYAEACLLSDKRQAFLIDLMNEDLSDA